MKKKRKIFGILFLNKKLSQSIRLHDMYRRRGLNQAELRDAYEQQAQSTYESEEDTLKKFGKPPYEFLGEIASPRTRVIVPRYGDFSAVYVDEQGREYAPIGDDTNDNNSTEMFVRIPLSKTRMPRPDYRDDYVPTYEERLDFPNIGDTLRLKLIEKKKRRRRRRQQQPPDDSSQLSPQVYEVHDVRYEYRRAVGIVQLTTT
jgi:hypothetical protein